MKKKVHCGPLSFFRITAVALLTILAIPGESGLAAGFVPSNGNSCVMRSAPVVTLDPDNLDFGDQVVRRTSAAQRTVAKNTGDSPLYIESIDLRGDDAKSFAVLKDTCTGATIEPDRACIVDVTFTPSGTGDRTARLRFSSNAPDSPQRLALKGKGINSIDVQPFEASK